MLNQTEIKGMWRIPIDMLQSAYEVMPISTSIDISFAIMGFFGVYYGWRLLRGSGISRAILELFTWLIVIYSLAVLLFPELQYFELQSMPTETEDAPLLWVSIGWVYLLVEVSVLYVLRKKSVKEYASVF